MEEEGCPECWSLDLSSMVSINQAHFDWLVCENETVGGLVCETETVGALSLLVCQEYWPFFQH